jgi:hypothetical protein
MFAFSVFVMICALGVSPPRDVARAQDTASADADVLIQAGHEGRPDCDREPQTLCRNTGAAGEIQWTPIVADEATRILRAAGVTVIRRPAFLEGEYHVQEALFIHFDGSEPPCSSGASVGYPQRARSAEAAAEWKSLYKTYFPFRFEPDNFTPTLAGYYGYKHVRSVSDAAIVIEGGEMTCPAQHAWMKDRLKFEGALIAHFISKRIGKGNVPLPAAP